MNIFTFWKAVATADDSECWNWKRAKDRGGYGVVHWQGKTTYAHRIAFFLFNGYLPDGSIICHRCDNPPCCNPAHLFVGTDYDNAMDRHRKGRTKTSLKLLGRNHHSAKLTDSSVLQMRSLFKTGVGVVRLGRMFGVSHVAAGKVVRGLSWKRETPSLKP